MKKKTIMSCVSVVIALVLILCPLSMCFAAGEVVDTVILELLWQTLKSWGIEIVQESVDEFNDNVEEWLNGELQEYLEEELQQTIDAWITGFNWTYDNFGRLMVNNRMLTSYWAFATWLKLKLNLIDNDVKNVVNGGDVKGIIGYYPPTTYGRRYQYVNYMYTVTVNYSYAPVFVYMALEGNSSCRCWAYSTQPFSVRFDCSTTGGGFPQDKTGTLYHNAYFAAVNPYSSLSQYNAYTDNTGYNMYVNQYSGTAIKDILDPLNGETAVPEDLSIDVVTGDITFPNDDPQYQPGYSIIYYPDGKVGYLDIQWPESISVDNLPAIVSTGSIPNPGFGDVFLPIRAFVNTFSDGMAVIKDVIFHLPTEVIAIFYAIMSITVIFGALHMFKEH